MRQFLLIAIALGSVAVAQPVSAQKSARAPAAAQLAQDRRNFEAGMLDSAGGPVLQTIRRLYPTEYEKFIDENFNAARRNLGDEAALRRVGTTTIASFFRRKISDVVNAPAPVLARINSRQLDLVRALRKDQAQACAQYVNAGFDGTTELPLPLQQRATGISIAILEAAKEGSRRPRDRSRGAMDTDAAVAWLDKIVQVEPSPAIHKMMDDEAAQQAATPDQTCQMGIAIYAAIAELPAEQAAKMTAYMLKSSMEP